MEKYILVLVFLLLGILYIMPGHVLASSMSSANYKMEPLDVGNNSGGTSANSSGFRLQEQQINDTAINQSSSTNYIIQHGLRYTDATTSGLFLNFTFSPQGRFGPSLSNDQTHVTIEVRPIGGDQSSIIYSQTVVTNAAGQYFNLPLTNVNPGIYDVTAKGWATLRRKKTRVTLPSGTITIDFTNNGTNKAIAGDIDNITHPVSNEIGDNEVNAADYSVMVGNYNLTGSAEDRYDLKQFGGGPSASDYSLLVSNYDQRGDN